MRSRNFLDIIHNEFRFPIIIILIVIMYFNSTGNLSLDVLLDRTPEENLNIFLNDVNNINPSKTNGELLTGIEVYDTDVILYNMLYEMGENEYYVYLFTKDSNKDLTFNNIVTQYRLLDTKNKMYSINASQLEGTTDSSYMSLAPAVLKFKRDNSNDGKPIVSVSRLITDTTALQEELNSSVVVKEDKNSSTAKEEDDESVIDSILGFFGKGDKDNESESENIDNNIIINNENVNNDKEAEKDDDGGFFSKLFHNGSLR